MGSEYKPLLLFVVVCLTFPLFFMFGITNLIDFPCEEEKTLSSTTPQPPLKQPANVDIKHQVDIQYVDELGPIISDIEISSRPPAKGKSRVVKRSVKMDESEYDYAKDYDPVYGLPYELSEEDYFQYSTPHKHPQRSLKRDPSPSRRKDLSNKYSHQINKKKKMPRIDEPPPPVLDEEKRKVKLLPNKKKNKMVNNHHLSSSAAQSLTMRKKSEDEEKKDEDNKAEEKKMNAMLNPKPPLDLPIVKPEVQKLENEPAAKLIPTRGKPFHFHIPIVSKEPHEKKLSLEEITEIAKKYKNPLTLNPVVYKAAASGQILTEKQLNSIKRMVRDSKMLNFLNVATLASGSENGEIGKDLHDLMGSKRSILRLEATDEILQELVGDTDDLKNLILATRDDTLLAEGSNNATLSAKNRNNEEDEERQQNHDKLGVVRQKFRKKPGAQIKGALSSNRDDRVEMGNSPRRKRVLDQNDFFKDDSILPNDEIVSSQGNHRFKREITEEINHHHRSKRGFGRWIKSVFGFGKTTTPIPITTTKTTTTTPPPSSSSSSSSSEESGESNEKAKRKKHKKKSKKHKKKKHGSRKHNKSTDMHKSVQIEYDSNGDSEVDFLLPVSLRRSTWLKKHAKDKLDEEEDEEDEDYRKKRDEIQKEPTIKKLGRK